MAHKKDQDHKPTRYITPEGSEAESEPGSRGRVLRNRLGIRRKMEMDRLEFESLVAAQEEYLECIGPDTRLTTDLLCRMHRDWLGEIYEWAGRYRTVELAKEDSVGRRRFVSLQTWTPSREVCLRDVRPVDRVLWPGSHVALLRCMRSCC